MDRDWRDLVAVTVVVFNGIKGGGQSYFPPSGLQILSFWWLEESVLVHSMVLKRHA